MQVCMCTRLCAHSPRYVNPNMLTLTVNPNMYMHAVMRAAMCVHSPAAQAVMVGVHAVVHAVMRRTCLCTVPRQAS